MVESKSKKTACDGRRHRQCVDETQCKSGDGKGEVWALLRRPVLSACAGSPKGTNWPKKVTNVRLESVILSSVRYTRRQWLWLRAKRQREGIPLTSPNS
eukprot:6184477-Pleurochrysis_carterae.AAC.3